MGDCRVGRLALVSDPAEQFAADRRRRSSLHREIKFAQRRRDDRLHVCLQEVAGAEPSDADRLQPLTAILGMPRPPVRMARPSASFRAERRSSPAAAADETLHSDFT